MHQMKQFYTHKKKHLTKTKHFKVNLTYSFGSGAESQAQIADWRGFTACKLLISRVLMGTDPILSS